MLLAIIIVLSFPIGVAFASTSTFFNVLVQNGADASVYKDTDGTYYSAYTTGAEVKIWKSNYLTNIDSDTVITA